MHGARHRGSAWSGVVEQLDARGCPAIAPDLPADRPGQGADPDAGRADAAGAELVELSGGRFPMLTRPGRLADLLAGIAAVRAVRAGTRPGRNDHGR